MSALRRARVNARLSIKQLAEKSGVGVDTISRIEADQDADPRAETLGKLADVLEVDPADIDPVLNPPASERAA